MHKNSEYIRKYCKNIPRTAGGRYWATDKICKYEQNVDRFSALQYNNQKENYIYERMCLFEDDHQKNGL